jgi:hypothetical protein
MKKLLVKIKVIDIPYSTAIEAIQESWSKELENGLVNIVYSQPLDELGNPDSSYTYFPAVSSIPEQSEVSHEEIIAQTQGSDDELAQWLAGDCFKYPEGYQVEYIDITAQVEQDKINAEALAYLASTDWMIIRETETQVACPAEIKQLRAEARLKVVK